MTLKVSDNRTVVGGLLAVSILIFQSYLSISPDKLDFFQKGALVCFAIAIPGYAFWFWLYFLNNNHSAAPFDFDEKFITAILVINIPISFIATLVGFCLVFWRLLSYAGIVFLVVCGFYIASFIFWGVGESFKGRK